MDGWNQGVYIYLWGDVICELWTVKHRDSAVEGRASRLRGLSHLTCEIYLTRKPVNGNVMRRYVEPDLSQQSICIISIAKTGSHFSKQQKGHFPVTSLDILVLQNIGSRFYIVYSLYQCNYFIYVTPPYPQATLVTSVVLSGTWSSV